MNSLPVKLILYRDICGNNFMKLALAERAEDEAMDLMLSSYVDVNIWCAGTQYEILQFLGNE